MKEKLYNLLAEILEMESSEIDNSTGLGNCDNWDSISLLMIVSELEEAFERYALGEMGDDDAKKCNWTCWV